MPEPTASHLPAGKVVRACEMALAQIQQDRATIMNGIANERRMSQPFYWRDSLESALSKLTKPDMELVNAHRARDEDRMVKIRQLAWAVRESHEDFTVLVSADDFAIMYPHYKILMEEDPF